MTVILSGITTVVSSLQSSKAYSSIFVTVSGISTLLSAVFLNPPALIVVTPELIVTAESFTQSLNIFSPIINTSSSINTSSKLSQPANALPSTYDTLLGIVTLVRLSQLLKAPPPIVSTELPILKSLRLVHPPKLFLSINLTPFPITTFSIPVHSSNAPFSKDSLCNSTTLSGITISFKDVHLVNAELPIISTPLDIVKFSNPSHS